MQADFARHRRGNRFAALLIAAAALGLGFTPYAPAATYTVDTVTDESDAVAGGVCAASNGRCTLRAAIEVANAVSGRDIIAFDSKVFDAELADTIEPVTQLPAITDPVAIDNKCPPNQYNDIPMRPCAGLDAAPGTSGFLVKADEVTIEGIAITGAEIGIEVVHSADEFVSRRNWIGADLELEAAGNGTGIFLGPGANEATIGAYGGGTNRIVNNSEVGLDLEGASRALVTGNGFGTVNAEPAPNGTNIEITDAAAPIPAKAEENQIGVEAFSMIDRKRERCFEGCNEIAGAIEDGINLQGDDADELPASGPTVIKSNFFGTDWWGQAALPNGNVAILVGEADGVTVGGPLEKEGNLINGGLWAVTAGPAARGLALESNSVGIWTLAGPLDPPSAGAFSIHSSGGGYPEGRAEVAGNWIAIGGGVGISSKGGSARIADNYIFGVDLGIHVFGESAAWWGRITGNKLGNLGDFGILVESSAFQVFGNEVYEPEKAGIRVAPSASDSVRSVEIGGDEAGLENTIGYSDGVAIEVSGDETEFVDIAGNNGFLNDGLFIDLGADGPGNQPTGPNRGVQPPTVASATTTGSSGMASPSGAIVRVFAKDLSSPDEIVSFVGSAATTSGGNWSVSYEEPLPPGTQIGVSQSPVEGTSELAFATTAPPAADRSVACAPPSVSTASGCVNAPCPPMRGCDGMSTRPLFVRLDSGPEGSTTRRTVTFRFSATATGSRFQCKLDRRKFARCRSPKAYKKLRPGKHVFKVKATDAAGNVSTVVTRKFTVLE